MTSSYAKILGETNFQPQEIPRSGSKAKDREKKEKKREQAGLSRATLEINYWPLLHYLGYPIGNNPCWWVDGCWIDCQKI